MFKKMIKVLVIYILIGSVQLSLAADAREKISLNDAERHHVLSEMRLFLNSVQKIIQAVAEDNLQAVADYAKKAGRAGATGAPPSLRAKLPKQFRILGSQTHAKFDQLAMDAVDIEDKHHALMQLSDLMKNCISCHQAYQIELSDIRSK